jgi:arginase family enzyme
MSNVHFIKAPCHQSSRKQGFQIAPDEIKESYDHCIDVELFNGTKIDFKNGHQICKGYTDLYEHIKKHIKQNPDSKIVTIGGDHSISAATIAAINEQYIKQEDETFTSDLKILWIDSCPDLHNYSTSLTHDLNDMVNGSLLGLCDPTFVPHKLLLKHDQYIFYGVQENSDIDMINNFDMEFYTSEKIKYIGVDKLKNFIKSSIGNSPVHVSIDMKVFNVNFAPSTYRNNDMDQNMGLFPDDVLKLLLHIVDKIRSVDIVEFNPLIGNSQDAKKTRELARSLIKHLFDIKEKKINIFSDDSEFLIYRSIEQINPHDIGWYILENLSLDQRDEIIKNIPLDAIITLCVDDCDILVTKTTMSEQNNKSYYSSRTIQDITLFPDEKQTMCFKLLDTTTDF